VSLALADELLLITHDFQSGKARLSDPALGIGLSAALLAELVFSGALVVTEGRLSLGEYPPPAERLNEALFEQTRGELLQQEVSVRDWLASHRRLVLDLVADRMVRAGELRRDQHKRLGRTSTRFYPTKPSEAFIRVQRLSSYLRTRIEISAGDAVLAALVIVMAPNGHLLDLDDEELQYLEQLTPLLPLPLRELLAITEASILAAQRNPLF
jgi:hypothetical protein